MLKSQLRLEAKIIAAVLGGPRTPPVDLFRIAGEMNVSDIRYIHGTSLKGATHFHADGPVIYLGRLETASKIRFTFAHELAHVMLRMPEIMPLVTRHVGPRLSKEGEERLANRIAETLLIPDDWVDAIRTSHSTLAKLESAASLADVSVPMLIARLATAGKDISLLHWQRGKHSWYVIDRPGTPPYLHGRIELSEAGTMALDDAGRSEQDIVVDGYTSQHHIRIKGRGRRQGKYAIQLLRPSRDVRMAGQPRYSMERSGRSKPVVPGRYGVPAW
jgi:IrrE N-terminal-like domain